MKLLFARLLEMVQDKNPGLIGAVVGFVIAVLIMIFGLLKTIIIVIFTLVGYFVGVRLFSDKEKIKNFLDKLIPPGRFR